MTRSMQEGRRGGVLMVCNTVSQTPLMLCLEEPQKRDLGRAWEKWCNEGMKEERAAGFDSGGACVWACRVLWRFLCVFVPAGVLVFLWSHAALCTIPQLWVTGPWVEARQWGQNPPQERSFLRLLSLIPPESSARCFVLIFNPDHSQICISPTTCTTPHLKPLVHAAPLK